MKLPPAVRWEIEKVPRELLRLDKGISRQTVESTNCFHFVLVLFLAAYEKVHEEEDKKKKKEVYSFQTGFRENIKEPGLTGFENNAVSPDNLKLFKGSNKNQSTLKLKHISV